MSTRRTVYRSSYSARARPRTAIPGRDWRLRSLVAVAAVVAVAGYAVVGGLHSTPAGSSLPLADASIIREQAAEKQLDPALIAAVIYAETKFDPRTSSAGALGLMQLLPETANFIARESGGVRFTTADLATPAVNLAYGSWYLRYLLNHYEGNELDAVAAYNAGYANVDRWVSKARSEGAELSVSTIPFPETREYVRRVLAAQSGYRAAYSQALGLAR
jgi:soluble lytic murein transglycosylase